MFASALRRPYHFVNFSRDLNRVFFAAVLLLVLAVSACETGQDSSGSMPLAGPRSIQVTARDKELVLQWTKVSPAQGVVPSYDVYYSITANSNGAEKWETAESNTSQLVSSTITGLVNHTTYYLWVKAIYQGLGESDFSPIEYSMPIPPPAAPGTLQVTSSEQMLEVTWGDVEDAFTYEVNYKAGGSGAIPPEDTAGTMLTVSEPGAVIFGLTNSTSYTVWVRARNTAGESSYSSGNGAPQVASSTPTSAPVNLALTPGGKKLTLTWDQVSSVPAYKIYYGTTNNIGQAVQFSQTIPAAAPTVRADVTGLTNGVLYYVWVKSSNSKGESSASQPVSGTPQAKAPINFSNFSFQLGTAAAEYIFAQDLPPSVFFPDGRPNTDRLTRVQETALGNLFCDGAAWYIRTQYPEENIDFVFLNGGYIDNGLSKGTITLGSLSGIVQPDNRAAKFMLLTLTGTELKKFFNDTEGKYSNIEPGDVSGVAHSGRGGPPNTKFFGIVSKEVRYTLKYYKAPDLPVPQNFDAEPYQHGFIYATGGDAGVLKINGQAIVDNQEYRICTTDELASGAYFVQLYAGKNKRVINTPFWHGVAEYVYDQGLVTPGLDGRIKVEGGVPLPPPWVAGNLAKP
jgi:fibronectin type 3 domain-containing protein